MQPHRPPHVSGLAPTHRCIPQFRPRRYRGRLPEAGSRLGLGSGDDEDTATISMARQAGTTLVMAVATSPGGPPIGAARPRRATRKGPARCRPRQRARRASVHPGHSFNQPSTSGLRGAASPEICSPAEPASSSPNSASACSRTNPHPTRCPRRDDAQAGAGDRCSGRVQPAAPGSVRQGSAAAKRMPCRVTSCQTPAAL